MRDRLITHRSITQCHLVLIIIVKFIIYNRLKTSYTEHVKGGENAYEKYIKALIGTITAVITVSLTNYFSKKNSMQLEERKIKQDYYIQFIKTLSDSMNDLESDDVVIAHNHAYNNLMLVASTRVISAIAEYQNLVINHIKGDKKPDYSKQHDRLLSHCFKEMRADLYGDKSKINKNYPNEITFLSGVLRIKK